MRIHRRLSSLTLAATLALASAASAQSIGEADDLYAGFLAENGEDLEGCLDEFVAFQSGPDGPDLAQAGPPAPRTVIIAVDASGSMAGPAGGVSKMDAAKAAVDGFVGTLPEDIAVGFVAFGHQGNNEESGRALSCEGVELLASAGSDRAAIRSHLDGLSATGWTPLAAAIEAAGSALEPSTTAGEQVVYVVSDGEETCDGDPVAAARTLHEGDIRAVVNIIGLDLPAADRAALEGVASAGGGVFESVADAEGLTSALEAQARSIGEMTRVRAMSGHATAANNSAVGGAMLRVNTCVAGIITRENSAFGSWLQGQRDAGTANDILDRVSELRTERHSDVRDRARALYDALRAGNEAANDAIRQGVEAAEEANDANSAIQ
jgi:Ca-activated chloride channel family protein